MDFSRIYDTIHYVESNYNKQITVQALENVSCYSYRNLQRIFKYACNETIGAYQARLKLENAYKLILYTNQNISLIACEVGFESLQAFSKAFKKQYRITPTQARKQKATLVAKVMFTPLKTIQTPKPEIVYLPAINVYYQTINTNYDNDELEMFWQNFLTNTFPAKELAYYGVIADEPLITDKIKCRYDACCNQQSINKKLPVKPIFGGKYAKFMHYGSYSSIDETYSSIYANWIFTTQLEFDNTPIIEQYIKHETNTKNEKEFVTAILLPLRT